MSYCPECRAEFRPGFEHCQSCDVALVATLEALEGPDLSEVEEALARGEARSVARGSLTDCARMRELLMDVRVAAKIIGDPTDCSAGTCATYDVVVAPAAGEQAALALQSGHLQALVREGADAQALAAAAGSVALDAGAEISCPACTASFVPGSIEEAECPDCGLFLGVPVA